MSLISRSSPFPSPNNTVINTVSPKMSNSTTRTLSDRSSKSSPSSSSSGSSQKATFSHSISIASPSDPFLSQYIKTPSLRSSLNNHQLYFKSINRQRKIKSYEIYQKYLVNTKPYVVPHIKSQSPSIVPPVKVVEKSPQHAYRSGQKKPQVPEKKTVEPKPIVSPPPVVKRYLPQEFMDCPIDDLINLITRMMSSLISLNDKSVPASISKPSASASSSSNSLLTRYHSRTPPSISTHTYLTRLTKFNNFNSATLLTTIYYIDLLSHQYQPFFTLNSWTVHRFLLVGTMLSQKCMEDFFYTNDHYAKVGGVAISELNCLELDFLERVDWRCMPGKQLHTKGESSIKYAKDVLELYYNQLIELMGKNTTTGGNGAGNTHIHYLPGSASPQGTKSESYPDRQTISTSGDDGSIEDSDDYDSMEEDDYGADEDDEGDSIVEDEEEEIVAAQTEKFDANGYSVDGSSSPHLKRKRYAYSPGP